MTADETPTSILASIRQTIAGIAHNDELNSSGEEQISASVQQAGNGRLDWYGDAVPHPLGWKSTLRTSRGDHGLPDTDEDAEDPCAYAEDAIRQLSWEGFQEKGWLDPDHMKDLLLTDPVKGQYLYDNYFIYRTSEDALYGRSCGRRQEVVVPDPSVPCVWHCEDRGGLERPPCSPPPCDGILVRDFAKWELDVLLQQELDWCDERYWICTTPVQAPSGNCMDPTADWCERPLVAKPGTGNVSRADIDAARADIKLKDFESEDEAAALEFLAVSLAYLRDSLDLVEYVCCLWFGTDGSEPMGWGGEDVCSCLTRVIGGELVISYKSEEGLMADSGVRAPHKFNVGPDFIDKRVAKFQEAHWDTPAWICRVIWGAETIFHEVLHDCCAKATTGCTHQEGLDCDLVYLSARTGETNLVCLMAERYLTGRLHPSLNPGCGGDKPCQDGNSKCLCCPVTAPSGQDCWG